MRLINFMLLILLVGCTSTETRIVETEAVVQHPPMPTAIFCPRLDRESIQTTDGNPSITASAVFSFGTCQHEVLRYIHDAESTLCYYREKLDEPRCEPYRQFVEAMRSPQGEE